jgi:hypothetical protein
MNTTGERCGRGGEMIILALRGRYFLMHGYIRWTIYTSVRLFGNLASAVYEDCVGTGIYLCQKQMNEHES